MRSLLFFSLLSTVFSLDLAKIKAQSDQIVDTFIPSSVPGAVFLTLARNGSVIYSRAAGVRQQGSSEQMRLSEIFWLASATKIYAAMSAVKLVDLGLINLDDSVLPHLPVLAAEQVRTVKGDPNSTLVDRVGDITLRNLLAYNSGLGYPLVELLAVTPLDVIANSQTPFFPATKSIFEGPHDAQPNTVWEYGAGADWEGQLVEALTNMTLGNFINKYILRPSGVFTDFTFHLTTADKARLTGANFRWPNNGTVVPRGPIYEQDNVEFDSGGAGGYSTATAFALGLLPLVNKGKHPITKQQILKSDLVAQMLTGQLTDQERAFLDEPTAASPTGGVLYPGIAKNWGLGAMIFPQGLPSGRGNGTFSWAGFANTHWYVDNQKGIVSLAFAQIIPQEDTVFLPNVRDAIEKVIYDSLGNQTF